MSTPTYDARIPRWSEPVPYDLTMLILKGPRRGEVVHSVGAVLATSVSQACKAFEVEVDAKAMAVDAFPAAPFTL